MSSRVNLSLLVDHINNLTKPKMNCGRKFKLLYCGSPSRKANLSILPPPLERHVPESFFSFSASTKCLISLDGGDDNTLCDEVEAAFTSRVSVYSDVLRCRDAPQLPKEILYVLLPFEYGNIFGKDNNTLGQIVDRVGDLLSAPCRNLKKQNRNLKKENRNLKKEVEELKSEIEALRLSAAKAGSKRKLAAK